ncbi:HET-domain-containing protein [Cadophora sp. DSE1049]|nr:HET-domain-containing protein [Cadophora sp. DSE1049]
MAYCRSSCIDPGCLDYAAIGSLLKHCNRTHKVCRPSPWPSLPIQLIDCMEQKVVPALESCDYTTLSYVWGKSPDESYVSSDGSLVNPPATIRDAMTVTLALGYRYIWIDRYCIDQNDTTKKLAQIWQMGSVYRASVLTIFSTGGTGPQHGLPGVGKTLRQSQIKRTIHGREIVGVLDQPRKLIEDSVWMSRGWTYQEAMLSKRRLCLTDQQFYFECCSDLSRDEIYGLGNRYMKVTTA